MSSGLRPLTASSSASAGNSPASRSTTSSGGPPGAGASSPPSLGRLVCVLIKGVLSGPATGSDRPPEVPAGKVNVTDPDSRPIPIGFGFVQGYNAQAAVNEQQIVLGAEITNNSTDFSQLDPMVTATLDELERAGIDQLPDAVAADAGYWNEQHMDEVVANKHIPVLVAPDKGTRGTPQRWLTSGRASWMRTVLATEHGHERYRKRKQTVEPLFGNTKHNGGFYRFHRRGRIKVRLEWRLVMMTHNITKVHRHQLATMGA